MSSTIFQGGQQRMLAYQKLKIFIVNPGRYALIILGSRGTGKRFAIESAFSEVKSKLNSEQIEELCLKEIKFIKANDIPEINFTVGNKMDLFLNDNNYNTVVLEDIEELESEQKNCLFEALSTKDGKFGIVSKHAKVRFIFTSSKPVDDLRTGVDTVSNIFWDRISQLVVELPSYKSENENIFSDFEATWKKMNYSKLLEYKGLDVCPKDIRIKSFFEKNADKLDGGFRDLDKIAILYFNYRIFHYGDLRRIKDDIEEKVYKDVKDDFLGRTQVKEESSDGENIFDFDNNFKSLEQMNSAYKVQLRKWALKKYKRLGKAARELNCSIHTLKNYREEVVKNKSNKKKKAK